MALQCKKESGTSCRIAQRVKCKRQNVDKTAFMTYDVTSTS